ncbi:hypothetical protein HNQ59_000502 [Chitinivorax tropicus]|uniref:Porin family protein n=1 Tax=Chitinivorax tropicus TaxID=714531 RepID=A0A840MFR2_9PROT|nr:outer membrane beta-barrel protein [Chitinivorax tropicus]MBB5017240.1 hypothetical protein [Chitinivorax tropicus]
MKKWFPVLALLCCGTALADTDNGSANSAGWKVGGGVGVTMGGDEFGKIHVVDKTNGKVVNNENLRAGRLFQLDFGTKYRFSNLPVSLQTTFGYHFDTVQGDDPLNNGAKVSYQFFRYPIEIIPAYHFDKHSVGLGLRYDLRPTYEFTGRFNYKFKNAPGLILQYEYEATDNVSVGLRYTAIKYKFQKEEDGSQTFKGNHVGMNAHVWF